MKSDCLYHDPFYCSVKDTCDGCEYTEEFIPCPSCGKKWWREKPFCLDCRIYIPQAVKDIAELRPKVRWEGEI